MKRELITRADRDMCFRHQSTPQAFTQGFRILCIVLLLTHLMPFDSLGQKLSEFRHSSCDEGNYHRLKLNTMINKMTSVRDSLLIDLTWIDNCSFKPILSLNRIEGDTLYFDLVNGLESEPAACVCSFRFQLTLTNIKHMDYQIKIGTRKIDKRNKRYLTDGYVVEYFPGRAMDQKKCREIYFDKGYLIAEVFYNRDGDIVSEKYYNETWGFFERERKY